MASLPERLAGDAGTRAAGRSTAAETFGDTPQDIGRTRKGQASQPIGSDAADEMISVFYFEESERFLEINTSGQAGS